MRIKIEWRGAIALAALAVGVRGRLAHRLTKVTWDKNFNFSEHKHYAWKKNELVLAQSPENLVLLDKSIMESVNQKLKSEGFTLDIGKAGFLYFL